jgi:ubiquinone/menaquinone biosynthesis C-methylase UbiE
MDSKSYWNRNLDTDNLSREGGTRHLDMAESLAFARTPEFEWLAAEAGDPSGRILLDVGGGVGLQALLWARAGARVVVADLAVERLKALRQLAREAGLADRMLFVAARAERLPLREGSVDFVFTKSVLIHTRLTEAAPELRRALRDGGKGLFIEPLNRNPIIRLYRALFAPRVWRSITRYFDDASLAELGAPFGGSRSRGFYLLAAGSFFWQYGVKSPRRFEKSLKRWMAVDKRLIRRLPWLEKYCWFASVVVEK